MLLLVLPVVTMFTVIAHRVVELDKPIDAGEVVVVLSFSNNSA